MKSELSKIEIKAEHLSTDAIGNDFIVLDDISKVPLFNYPTKVDFAVFGICLKGRIEGTINLKPVSFTENDTFIVLPEQIIQHLYISDDFKGLIFMMSTRFLNNLELSIKDSISVLLYVKENPVIHLTPDEIGHLLRYYEILIQTIRMPDNTNRLEIVRLLLRALLYIINDFSQLRKNRTTLKPKRERVFDAFYNLVLTHYKESRKTAFYAEKLCLTPKYLSRVIKGITGKSVCDWIDDYVILEAKSLLKSSNMSIQQISDQLNFPNQSFFGRFFKRLTGVSPSGYKKA